MQLIRMAAKSARARRAAAALLGVGLVLAVTAVVYAATSASFTLSVQPPSETISSGSTTTYVLSVSPTTAPVSLSVGAVPKGMVASWTVGSASASGSSVSIPASSGTRTATLTLGGGQPPAGTYSPTVTATASGYATQSVALTLNVVNQNAANFTLSVNPTTQTVAQGTSASTVAITRANWTGAVALSTAGLPAGTSAAFSPTSTTGSASNLTITTTDSTPAGTYTVDVVGSAVLSGSTASTRYAAVTLTVLPMFSISGSLSAPTSLVLGSSQPLDLSITNPYSTPLTVSNLRVSLASINQAAGAKGTCNQTGANSPNFQVGNLPASYAVTVPANSTAKLSQLGAQKPTVTWLDQPGFAQNGCLGAHLTFAYSGSGTF